MGKSEQLCVKTLMEQLNNVEHNISNEDYCKLKENYRLIMTILWIKKPKVYLFAGHKKPLT